MQKQILFTILLIFFIDINTAQTGPGGIGNTSSNVLWIRSEDLQLNDGDLINLWTDYSSFSNNLSQNINAYQPHFKENQVNTYPVVRFDQENNRIRKTNFNNFPSNEITAIYVNKTGDSNEGILSYASGNNQNNGEDNAFLIFGSSKLAPHIYDNKPYPRPTTSVNDNVWHIINVAWRNQDDEIVIWKDGKKDYQNTVNYSNPIAGGGCFAVAGEQDGVDTGYSTRQAHQGDFTEIILFNTYLNKTQHIIISNYLGAKYDISLAANDFYTQDDNGNGNFDFNVAGIGQADDGSNHTDSQGSGIIRINNPSDLNNDEYLFWGENQKYATYDFTQVDAETYRINTQWRVSKRNDLGTISLSFEKNNINLDNSVLKCASLKLIVSNLSDFSNKTDYALNFNNGTYFVDNVNFSDGDYFSLEYSLDKTTWDGNAWSTTPDMNKKAYFNADYDTSTQNSLSVCSCEIASGKNLHITDGKYLEVQNDIVNNGTILIENEGALVQHDNNSSITGNGIFQLNKTSMPLDHFYDYVFWASPIQAGQLSLGDIHPDSWRYYKYDPTIINNPGQIYPGWIMLSATDIVEAGIGYAISASVNHTAGNSLSAQFTKGNDPFNNGEITVNVYKRGGTNNYGDNNLLGNPYPSAIDFNQFASENPSVEGSYALWTKCAGLDVNGHHQEGGYTVYTVSGGAGTATAACNGNGLTASRHIATTQGFMINAVTDNSTATFSNTQRVTGNNDNFLNRPSNDNDIVWLDLLNDNGKFSQTAIGFYPGATDGYDRMYDAKNANSGSGFSLSSLLNGEKYAIQGLKKTGFYDKIIPLFIENDSPQNITFRLNRTEGFENTDIYLNDLQTQEIINLKETNYTSFVDAGEIDNRFELIFENILHNDENIKEENNIIILQNKGIFTISNRKNHIINSVEVYDINGRILFQNREVKQARIQIDLKQISTGNLLIFKIVTEDNNCKTKKIIIK